MAPMAPCASSGAPALEALRRWVQIPARAAHQPSTCCCSAWRARRPMPRRSNPGCRRPPTQPAWRGARRPGGAGGAARRRRHGPLDACSSADPARTAFEVQAAALALGVHAADGQRVSRERAVQACTALLQRHPAQAGWAASDLAAWGEWRFGTRFAQILQSDVPMAFASRYAMVFSAAQPAGPKDQAALQAWLARGRV